MPLPHPPDRFGLVLMSFSHAKRQIRWPAYRHIIFDCDATLSAVEGIDSLAVDDDTRTEIAALTDAAMSGDASLNDVYAERLSALQPSRDAVRNVRDTYRRTAVEGAGEVIATLRELGHEVYVVSGGLAEPVREFAVHLGIAPENVYAVEAIHDQLSGRWWGGGAGSGQQYSGHVSSELTTDDGKAAVVGRILSGSQGGSMMVGDGLTDLAARRVVDIFVGFGGVSSRPVVAEAADVYIAADSLYAVLPLAAGTAGRAVLERDGNTKTFDVGSRQAQAGLVKFNDPTNKQRFFEAFGLLEEATDDHA